MQSFRPHDVQRHTKAYAEGAAAYRRGAPAEENPYDLKTQRRIDWFDGYYEQRIDVTCGDILRAYGESWP